MAELAPRTYELSVFLTGVLGVTDVGAYFPHKVTYHPSCHSLRMLKVGDAPLRLLRAVRGLNLADLPDAEACCGGLSPASRSGLDVPLIRLRR